VKKNPIPSGACLTAEQDDLFERNAINDIDRLLSVSEMCKSRWFWKILLAAHHSTRCRLLARLLSRCEDLGEPPPARLVKQITQELGVSDAPRNMVKDMVKLREVAQFDVRNPGASLSTTAKAVGLPPSKKPTVASYMKTPAFNRIRNDEYILYTRQQIRSATAAGDLKTALAAGRELDRYIEAQKNKL
jgi:hypothetical protein